MAKPFLSVITRIHRRPGALRALLGSILRQDQSDYELVIVSDDETDVMCFDILDEFRREHGMSIRVVMAPARGYPQCNLNNNEGLDAADGEYSVFIDDDDLYADDDYFASLKRIAAEHSPSLIISKCISAGSTFPARMGQPPTEADIGTECVCVKTELGRNHRWGDDHLGDLKFILSVYNSINRGSVYYNDSIVAKPQGWGRSYGQIEY